MGTKWYRKGLASGDPDAAFHLGKLERTRGNLSEAARLFMLGAKAGEPKSMAELAAAYKAGLGNALPRDLRAALHWYVQAADFSADAAFEAHLLYSGDHASLQAESDLADLYLERGARMGSFPAMQKFV